MNTQTTVKERPILFSGAIVRAILADKKTQTRRVVKPQPIAPLSCDLLTGEWVYSLHDDDASWRCPYGQPGDRLWVRECWAAAHEYDGHAPSRIRRDARYHYTASEERGGLLWRPSIHMPRWASRITLEIVSVRVERLQDISEADARAEGIDKCDGMLDEVKICEFAKLMNEPFENARPSFLALWDRINGKRPGCAVADNPWVWVVEFKREADHAE